MKVGASLYVFTLIASKSLSLLSHTAIASFSGNDEFFRFMLIFHLTDVYHALVVRKSAAFNLVGFESLQMVRFLHTSIIGKIVRIIDSYIRSSAESAMIR